MTSHHELFPAGERLNLGCGPVQPEGWTNVDGSNRAFLASRLNWLDRLLVRVGAIPPTEHNETTRYLNLLKGLPWPADSVAAIYAGELWEHFEYPDAEALTRECFRVLKPGGVLRVCVPDGPTFWRNYLAIYDAEAVKPPEQRQASRLHDHVSMYFRDICTRRVWLGSIGHAHKWQFDEVQLVDLLRRCGFGSVSRMAFHDSVIPEVHQVERSDFLIVEGLKL